MVKDTKFAWNPYISADENKKRYKETMGKDYPGSSLVNNFKKFISEDLISSFIKNKEN